MKSSPASSLLLAFVLTSLPGTPPALRAQTAARPAALPAVAELGDFVRLYQTDRNSVSRFYDLPWSEVRFERMEQLYADWQARLAAVDFEALNQAGRIDYVLLRAEIRAELSRLALDRRRLAEMEELLAFRGPLQALERSRWKMEPVDGQAAATKIASGDRRQPGRAGPKRELDCCSHHRTGSAGEDPARARELSGALAVSAK